MALENAELGRQGLLSLASQPAGDPNVDLVPWLTRSAERQHGSILDAVSDAISILLRDGHDLMLSI